MVTPLSRRLTLTVRGWSTFPASWGGFHKKTDRRSKFLPSIPWDIHIEIVKKNQQTDRLFNPYCHGLKHFSSVTGGGSLSPQTQSAPESTRRLIGGQNFYPLSLGIYTLRLWRKKVEKMSRSFTATVQKIFKNLDSCSILSFKDFVTYKKICHLNSESLQLHTQEW